MRISDWSSDVCSSDLILHRELHVHQPANFKRSRKSIRLTLDFRDDFRAQAVGWQGACAVAGMDARFLDMLEHTRDDDGFAVGQRIDVHLDRVAQIAVDQHRAVARHLNRELDVIVELLRSEEHTSELQSLMRISYAVFCFTKKKK